MTRTRTSLLFPLLAAFAVACGGGEGKPGVPTSLAAFNQFAAANGGSGGGGSSSAAFQAIAYDDLAFGLVLTSQPSHEVTVLCEDFQGAQTYTLLESPTGQNAFTANPAQAQALGAGQLFVFDEANANSTIDYKVQALDAGGAVLGESNVISCNFQGNIDPIPQITNPSTVPVIDPATQTISAITAQAIPATMDWQAPSVGTAPAMYSIFTLEFQPSINGNSISFGNATINFWAFSPNTSFDVTNGFYYTPPGGFVGGTQYLVIIVGHDGTGWRSASTATDPNLQGLEHMFETQ